MYRPPRPSQYATGESITPGGMFGLTPNVPYSATLEDLIEANKDREGLRWQLQKTLDRLAQLKRENEELKKERQSKPKPAGSVTDWYPLLQETRAKLTDTQKQLQDARLVLYNVPGYPEMTPENKAELSERYQEVMREARAVDVYPLEELLTNPKLTECLEKQKQLEAQISDLQSRGLQTDQGWVDKAKSLLLELPNYPSLDIFERDALQKQYQELLGEAPDLDSTLGSLGQAEESLRYDLDQLQSKYDMLINTSETNAAQLLEAQDQLATLQKSCAAAQVSGEIIEQLSQCQTTLKECQDRNASARKTVEEISSGLGLEGNVLGKRLALEGARIRGETLSAAEQLELLEQCRRETRRLNEENGLLRRQIAELQGPAQGGFDKSQFDRLKTENARLTNALETEKQEKEQAISYYLDNTRDIQYCQGDIELLQKIIGDLIAQKENLTAALKECIAAASNCAKIEGFEDLADLSQRPTSFRPIEINVTDPLFASSNYIRPNFDQLLEAANRIY